jgi:hypothetical protein
VVWEPISAAEKPHKLEAVSTGLRQALGGRGGAEGVAPDGMIYRAELGHEGVFIKEVVPAGAPDHRIAEPAGVVWSPHFWYKSVRLEEVSPGLRRALKAARPWSGGGRRVNAVVGPGGPQYTAWLHNDYVQIEQVIGATSPPVSTPEPEGIVWKSEGVGIEEVSEGLRKALEEGRDPNGRGTALGVGPDGRPYKARLHGGFVSIYIDYPGPVLVHTPILEPEGVVWRPLTSARSRIAKLTEVSEGLREALREARWPDGRRIAAGVGPEGSEYRAHLREQDVTIYQVVAGTELRSAIAEPAGVVWKPTLREKDWVQLEEVSEALRKALKEAERGAAVGVGPDGTEYRACVWHERLVYIGVENKELAAYDTADCRIPMPEPPGAAWTPFVSPHPRPRRRPRWRFWK